MVGGFLECISCCYGFWILLFPDKYLGWHFLRIRIFSMCFSLIVFYVIFCLENPIKLFVCTDNFGYSSAAYSYPPLSAKNVSTFDLINPSP